MNGEPLLFKSEVAFAVRWFMFGNQVHEDTTSVFRIASNLLTLRGKL